MTKRKWYVVTVGKSVGVYPTWVETAPLVKGVSEAIFQGFTSEAEARRVFMQEMSKGTTRIVQGESRSSHPTPRQTYSDTNVGHGTPRDSLRSPMTPKPRRNDVNVSPLRREKTETDMFIPSGKHSPSNQFNSPFSHSSPETRGSIRRFEIIDSLFKKESDAAGVEDRVSRSTQDSSPTKSMASFGSPRSGATQSPQVIFKTPSRLSSYPKARPVGNPQPLSPLSREDLPLNTFSSLSLTPSAVTSPAIKSPYDNCARSPDDSSMYMSPPHQERVVHHDVVDPRSPIRSKSQVPELAFVSPLLFSRPSPSSKGLPLPANIEGSTITNPTSLLFMPSPKTRKILVDSQA